MINYKESYLAVDPDFIDLVNTMASSDRKGKIFYFNPQKEVDEATGRVEKVEKTKDGEFLILEYSPIRLDRIITLFGKPGPAYDEYDAFANACLTCEDIDQF